MVNAKQLVGRPRSTASGRRPPAYQLQLFFNYFYQVSASAWLKGNQIPWGRQNRLVSAVTHLSPWIPIQPLAWAAPLGLLGRPNISHNARIPSCCGNFLGRISAALAPGSYFWRNQWRSCTGDRGSGSCLCSPNWCQNLTCVICFSPSANCLFLFLWTIYRTHRYASTLQSRSLLLKSDSICPQPRSLPTKSSS